MAYVMIRRNLLLDRRFLKHANVCGCCSLTEHKRYTTCRRRYISDHHSHRSTRHQFFKPLPIITQPSLSAIDLSSYVYKQGFAFIPHCDGLSHSRSYHMTSYRLKDESIVEKSVKALKEDKTEKQKTNVVVEEVVETVKVDTDKDEQPVVTPPPQPGYFRKKMDKWKITMGKAKEVGYLKYFWNAFKAFIKHYRDGFKLFWVDVKICVPLLHKYIRRGRSSLKRREYKQLTRTLGDLVRMVPLIPMLIIPFGELLIPLYISFGFMPSVFMNKASVEARNKKRLQKKLEYSALLTQSLQNVPFRKKKDSQDDSSTIKDFTEFLEKVKSTETMPDNEEIMKFSRLFEDELTLENLNVDQLQSLCKLLNIGFLGEIPSSRILRFQIGMKLRELEVDDKEIMKEGVDSLTIWELQAANRARGMRALGVPEDRLKLQIQQWLELHLKEQVPTTLLLLSRVMYLDENLSPAEQIKQTISALPETTVDKVKVEAAETRGEDVDRETKIKVLSEETKAIQAEEKQEREELEKEEKELLAKEEAEREASEMQRLSEVERIKIEEAESIIDTHSAMSRMSPKEKIITEEVIAQPDIAEPIVASTAEEIPDQADEELKAGHDNITSEELGIIEEAIEDMAKHHQDEFEEVKEDLDDYIEDVEDVKALCLEPTATEQIQESRGAQLLRGKLDKYLAKMDKMITKLQDERQQIQENMEYQEIQLKYEKEDKEKILDSLSDKKRNLISINEVLLSLKRLQRVPDDVRMQRVLEVLDTDDDGLIDINDVLKVTEILGRENLKLNKAEVSAMMNLLRKEEEIEELEKQQEKEEKELNKKDNTNNNNNNNNKSDGEISDSQKKEASVNS